MSSPKIWLITGANTGLGLDLANKALAEGDKVIAGARNPSSVPPSLSTNTSAKVLAYDQAWDQSRINDFAKEALAVFGKIDVLVNNAGYAFVGAIEEASDEDVKQQYDINVFGVLRLTRALIPSFRDQKSGVIANLSSVGGFHSGPGSGIYCSSKFAIEGLSMSLTQELAPFGISVLAIEPGYTRTEFLKNPSSGANIAPQIDAYKGTPTDDTRQALFKYNGKQPGDPKKCADRMWEVISQKGYFEGKKIPERLFLGSDAQSITRGVLKEILETLDDQVEVSKSTDLVE